MAEAIWAPIAEAELGEILFRIAADDGRPLTAEKNYFEIKDAAMRHAARSIPGRKHASAPADWFYFQHKRWFVFYRPHASGIEVVRVIDAKRDLPRVLKG